MLVLSIKENVYPIW